MLEARAQFAADVAEALQVLLGMADALLGLPAPLLVAGDPGGLFHEQLEIGGAGLHQPADGALFDDGVTAGPKASAEEEVGHVLAAALLAVDLVVVGAVAQHFAAHRISVKRPNSPGTRLWDCRTPAPPRRGHGRCG